MAETSKLNVFSFKTLVKYHMLFLDAGVYMFDEIKNLNFKDLQNKLNSSFMDTYSLLDEIVNINSMINSGKLYEIYNGELMASVVDSETNRVQIEEMNLSARSYHALKSAGFNYVDEIINLKESELLKIRNLGKGSAKEILDLIKDYNSDDLTFSASRLEIEQMGLSVRSYRALRNAGFRYFDEIKDLSEFELLDIKNLGKGSADEIVSKIKEIKSRYIEDSIDEGIKDSTADLSNADSEIIYTLLPEDDIEIEKLNLSVRTKNSLLGAGFVNISEIVNMTSTEFMNIRNMGRKSVIEIIEFISIFKKEMELNFDWLQRILNAKNNIENFKSKEFKLSSFPHLNMLKAVSNYEQLLELSFYDVYNEIQKRLNDNETCCEDIRLISIFILKIINISKNQPVLNLSHRELEILLLRDSKTLEEIASLYSITRERVRQIEAKALRKLRQFAASNDLEQYFISSFHYKSINDSLLDDELYFTLFGVLNKTMDLIKIYTDKDYFYCKKEVAESYQSNVNKLTSLIEEKGIVFLDELDFEIKYNEVFDYYLKLANVIRNTHCYYMKNGHLDKTVAYIKRYGEIDFSDENLTNITEQLINLLDFSYVDRHNIINGILRRNVISVGGGKYRLLDSINDISDELAEKIVLLINERKFVDCDDLMYELKDFIPEEMNSTMLYFKFKKKYPDLFNYGGTSLMITLPGQKASKAELVYDYLLKADSPVPNVTVMNECYVDKVALSVIDSQNDDIFCIDDVHLWLYSKMNIKAILEEIYKYLNEKDYFFVNDLYKYIYIKYEEILKINYITTFERFHKLLKAKCNKELKEFKYDRFKKDYTKIVKEESSYGFDFDF